MRARRLAAANAVIILAALGAACSAATDGPAVPRQAAQPPVTIPADPAAALMAAKAALGRESARFTLNAEPELGYTGIVNAETRNWEIRAKEYVIRRVGSELYVQASGETLASMMLPPATTDRLTAGGWVHTRLPNRSEQTIEYNEAFPWNLTNPATRPDSMTKTGDRSFSGTFTADDTRPSSKPRPALEFHVDVDLDERGRFTRVSLDPTGKSTDPTTVFTFSDYGVPADITAPPTADVAEEENPYFLPL